MTKTEAIKELAELDRAYDDVTREAWFWGKEYRLAGSASTYVKASQKPVIEARIQKARDKGDAIWSQMSALMEKFEIGAEDI